MKKENQQNARKKHVLRERLNNEGKRLKQREEMRQMVYDGELKLIVHGVHVRAFLLENSKNQQIFESYLAFVLLT